MLEKFENMNSYLNYVEKAFEQCYNEKGYIKESPVKITSQIDKTVDFIGSKISPLKHYLLENNIPDEGIYLLQNCMKVHALKHLKDYEPQQFGSCYKGMGTITKYDLEKVTFDIIDYLTNTKFFGIDSTNLKIRLSSSDKDLIYAVSNINDKIEKEFDTEPNESYKHIYGLNEQQITGRNYNIAMRKGNSEIFFDVASVIVMENPNEKLAIDMGIGNSSIAMCHYNTNNTVASSRIIDIINISDVKSMKFADSIVAVTTLLNENILEHPSKHFRKKFRQYLNALKFWMNELDLTDEYIMMCISKYAELEFNNNNLLNNNNYAKILKRR